MNEIFKKPNDPDILRLSSSSYEWAMIYAHHGYPVLPLKGKKPIVPNGYLDATTDQDVINGWWNHGKLDWNIGIPTGPASGIWVLDIDQKPNGANGAASLLEHTIRHGALPITVTQRTGTGTHLFFKLGETEVKCSTVMLGPGLDVRGEGGYVVVAPSVHPDTGTKYQWLPDQSLFDMTIPEAPVWLVEMTCKRKSNSELHQPSALTKAIKHSQRYGTVALDRECKRIEAAQNGQQERTLNSSSFAIGRLISSGHLSESIAVSRLKESAAKMHSYDRKNQWTKSQICQKIDRAIAQGKKSPRHSH